MHTSPTYILFHVGIRCGMCTTPQSTKMKFLTQHYRNACIENPNQDTNDGRISNPVNVLCDKRQE